MSAIELTDGVDAPANKTIAVENWVFVGVNGVTSSYQLRPDLGEKAVFIKNAIDDSILQIQLLIKDGTDKNETKAVVGFVLSNIVCYISEKSTITEFAKGQSPLEKELSRIAEVKRTREEAFQARQAAIDADLERELLEINRPAR